MIALISQGANGRAHFPPAEDQLRAALTVPEVDVPSVPLPEKGLGFRVQEYGFTTWMDLFTKRQQLALDRFSRLVREVPRWAAEDGADSDYAHAITEVLGLCVGKLSTFSSTQSLWRLRERAGAKAEAAFGRAVLPMTLDFAETNPFGGSVGDWMQVVHRRPIVPKRVARRPASVVEQRDARSAANLVSGDVLVATDPPDLTRLATQTSLTSSTSGCVTRSKRLIRTSSAR